MKATELLSERNNLQGILKAGSKLVGTLQKIFGDDADDLAAELGVQEDHEVYLFRAETPQQMAALRSVLTSPGKKVGAVKVVDILTRCALVKGEKVYFTKADRTSLAEAKQTVGGKLGLLKDALEESGLMASHKKTFAKIKATDDAVVDYAVKIFSVHGRANTYVHSAATFLKESGDAYNLWWNTKRLIETSGPVGDPFGLKEVMHAASTLASQASEKRTLLISLAALQDIFSSMKHAAASNKEYEGEVLRATMTKLGITS